MENSEKNINIKIIPVTIMLVLANVLAYIWCVKTNSDSFRIGGINYEHINQNKEYIRFVTHMFLHANLKHLLYNMFSLFIFGLTIEPKLGSFRTFIIYVGSGLASGFLSFYIYGIVNAVNNHYSVGASGAVYGIMAASFIVMYRKDGKTRPKDLLKALGFVVFYVVISIEDNVDSWAHLGGGVMGAVLAFVLTIRKWESFMENEFFKLVGILFTISLCVVGVGGAGIGKEVKALPDARVDFVKAQKVFPDANITYEEIFNKCCPNGKWTGFTSAEGQEVVQFEGMVHYKGKDREMLIQFILENNITKMKIWYFGFDGEWQNDSKVEKFFRNYIE